MILPCVPGVFCRCCGSCRSSSACPGSAALTGQAKCEFSADILTGRSLNSLSALVLMICDAVDLEALQKSISFTTVKMKWTDCFLFLLTAGCGHKEIATLC